MTDLMKAVVLERFGGAEAFTLRDVDLVGRKPANLSHLEAASLTLVGGTVWEALVTRAQLTVGETILIHGGTGGVGTIAIQVARAIGAERGLVKPVVGATLPLARLGEAHEILENRSSYGLRGKVTIDVVGGTVALPVASRGGAFPTPAL